MENNEMINKILAQLNTCSTIKERVKLLKKILYLISSAETKKKVFLPYKRTGFIGLNPKLLLKIEAKGRCSELSYFYNRKTEKLAFSKSLGELEKKLRTVGIFRVHNSYLVNLWNVSFIGFTDSQLRLSNGDVVPVSRNYMKSLKSLISIIALDLSKASNGSNEN